MSNKEKLSWCAGVVLLVLLYLLSSTDLIIKEKEKEICRISVIIDNVNDNYYGNFREGMETAEKKYQADVNFITLYAENDEEQQEDLIVREVKDGTNAVILAPVREDLAIMRLDEISPGCPVVFLGSSVISSSVTCAISVDRYEMGRTLGEKIAENEDPGRTVCLFTEGLSYTGNRDVYDGLRSVLDREGFRIRLIEKKSEDSYRQAIEETVYPENGDFMAVGMDVGALSDLADILEGSSVYREHVTALYGIGSTTAILNQMDRGIVKGLMTWNRFDEGYLSVEKAVQAMSGERLENRITLTPEYIDEEILKSGIFEKMLYPMQ